VIDIYTDCDNKKVEWDMYAAISYFRDSYDHYRYKYWESQLEDFFSYFELTTEEKYRYARFK